MIKVGNVAGLNEYQYDENWLIVRKPDEIPAFGQFPVPHNSPGCIRPQRHPREDCGQWRCSRDKNGW